MTNKLMLATCDNDDGDNLDLLIAAADAPSAIDLWRTYYDLDASDLPKRIFEMPTTVPAAAGALGWDMAGGPKEIWTRP